MYGFGVRSAQNYPAKKPAKNGKAPGSVANAPQGSTSGHGSNDSYPNAAKGKTWAAPGNYATASYGQTTGHPSQKTNYMGKGKRPYPESSDRVIKSESGKDHYSPKGGNML